MTPKKLSLRTPAKINPVLEVLGKRPDGYHELALVFQAVDLYDELLFSEGEPGVELDIEGIPLSPDGSNLVIKAAELFLREILKEKRGVRIDLKKRIPLAAGLGGGSSDAAATLRGLDWFFGTNLREPILQAMAEGLGSDVPFFLTGGAALGTGRGEKITPWAAGPERHLVLVKPERGLPTSEVFRSGKATVTGGEKALGFRQVMETTGAVEWAGKLFNGLETAALSLMPEIGEIRRQLLEAGVLGVLISGSGPTVFGVAEDRLQAGEVARRMEGGGRTIFVVKTLATGIERI